MSPTEERMQILKMIEAGTITAEEGAKLLAALEEGAEKSEGPVPGGKARWMRIRVTDLKTGRAKVNVNLPMGLVNFGMKMGARFAPEMENMDLNEIMQSIKEGAQGKIVEVEDDDDNERVQIYIE
jgi:predicted hydrocarbon binding protein